MSSHHIVRENQEPALLIENFRALSRSNLDQLLEWSPTVIADANSIDFLLSEKIKADILFSNDPIDGLQEQTKIFSVQDGFLRSALPYLVSHLYSAVNVMCLELDPLLQEYAASINIVAFCNDRRYAFVREQYEKWKPKGELIYINPQFIKSQYGLKHIDADIFETLHDGIFKLEFATVNMVYIGEDL